MPGSAGSRTDSSTCPCPSAISAGSLPIEDAEAERVGGADPQLDPKLAYTRLVAGHGERQAEQAVLTARHL